jgi:hypothetical protein
VEVSMARWRRGSVLLGLVLAIVACTPTADEATPPPTPAPAPPATPPTIGVRIGVVLPAPASEEDEQRIQFLGGLQLLDSLRDEGISEIRTLEADGPEFVVDLAALLAERRTDLICVLGPDAQRIVSSLAAAHPYLRFCAVPAGVAETPDNLTTVEVRFEELGHAIGFAAAAVAGDGPVAAILGSDRAGLSRLREGIRAGLGEVELLESTPSDEEEVADAMDAAVDAGATVAVVDVGVGAGAAVERAFAAGLQVIAPAAILAQAEAEGSPVLSWRMRWDVPLRPVVASMLDPEVEVPPSVGLAENVFVVSLGDALQGDVRRDVEAAVMELRRAVRDPTVPPVPPNGPDDADDADDDDAAEQGADADEQGADAGAGVADGPDDGG